MKILLSCIGTSDPIRGGHDGPMLHILRHYRPEKVVLFLTTEMEDWTRKDRRYEILETLLRERWNYCPEWRYISLDTDNPSDLDETGCILQEKLRPILREYEAWDILVNLSSGTPQMQIVLAQMAQEVRYHTVGIQVLNPDGRSGSGERTNQLIDTAQLMDTCEDNCPDAPNRCEEPKLLRLRREELWHRLETALQRRDFNTAYAMTSPGQQSSASALDELTATAFSPMVSRLTEHLYYRSRLDAHNAFRIARSLQQEAFLYPLDEEAIKGLNGKERKRCRQITEYYLMLRNFQRCDRLSDFVLRLNPLTVALQTEYLRRLLLVKRQLSLDGLLQRVQDLDLLSAEALREQAPDLLDALNRHFEKSGGYRDSVLTIDSCNALLCALDADGKAQALFADCEKLNKGHRNRLAHALCEIKEAEVQRCLHYSSDELTRRIEEIFPLIYPDFSQEEFERLFTVYDCCIAEIISLR